MKMYGPGVLPILPGEKRDYFSDFWKGENMSVKIKISYNTDEELEKIRKLLSPMFKEVKVSRNKSGRYRKAYTEIENLKV